MDVQMPVMNGYEATRRIRTSQRPDGAAIPIIATTANAFSDDISAALAAGMNAHVSKPIDIGQSARSLPGRLRSADPPLPDFWPRHSITPVPAPKTGRIEARL